jgi:hypothetical protein
MTTRKDGGSCTAFSGAASFAFKERDVTNSRLRRSLRATIAAAVRDHRHDDERKARIELARAKAKDFQMQAAEQLALAQVLEEDGKAS